MGKDSPLRRFFMRHGLRSDPNPRPRIAEFSLQTSMSLLQWFAEVRCVGAGNRSIARVQNFEGFNTELLKGMFLADTPLWPGRLLVGIDVCFGPAKSTD